MIVELHFDLRVQRQIYLGSRAELNQTDPLSANNFLPQLDERNDAARNNSRQKPHADLLAARFGRLESKQHVFVASGAFSLQGAEEFARRVFEKADSSAHRRVLHMNVYDREEDRNTLARPANEQRLSDRINDIHLAVPRS